MCSGFASHALSVQAGALAVRGRWLLRCAAVAGELQAAWTAGVHRTAYTDCFCGMVKENCGDIKSPQVGEVRLKGASSNGMSCAYVFPYSSCLSHHVHFVWLLCGLGGKVKLLHVGAIPCGLASVLLATICSNHSPSARPLICPRSRAPWRETLRWFLEPAAVLLLRAAMRRRGKPPLPCLRTPL